MTSRRVFIAQSITGSAFAALPGTDAARAVPAVGPFTVRADESHAVGPWILGGHYPVVVKVAGLDTNGRFSLTQLVQPPNSGPALHVHIEQDEWFCVISGTIGVKLGEEKWS
jgi:mannose-6-phosphate isomerase-like protein (cupin superfamily)